jgi:FkbM family methyltransferase
MVTLTGLVRTLAVTNQPLNCLPYQNQKTINFKNGWNPTISFAQFRDIRDSYNSVINYPVKQVGTDLFEADFGGFTITASIKTVCAFADLQVQHPEYTVTRLGDDFFRIKGEKLEIEGTSSMVGVFRELQYGEYQTDFKEKVVLDIGGFQGESAVFFSTLGAKKVIVYEPIREYCSAIQRNIALNSISAEVHQAGIGNENTILTTDVFDPTLKDGQKPRKEIIKIQNVSAIIEQSNADIAKIDCEGAEICLTQVPAEILRKIPYYMLELHGEDTRRAVTAKFMNSGFRIARIINRGSVLTIVHFRRAEQRQTGKS